MEAAQEDEGEGEDDDGDDKAAPESKDLCLACLGGALGALSSSSSKTDPNILSILNSGGGGGGGGSLNLSAAAASFFLCLLARINSAGNVLKPGFTCTGVLGSSLDLLPPLLCSLSACSGLRISKKLLPCCCCCCCCGFLLLFLPVAGNVTLCLCREEGGGEE